MLDPSFGSGGEVITPVHLGFIGALDWAALQPSAGGPRIVVADTEIPQGVLIDQAVLRRYSPDGQLDSTFGNQGRLSVELGDGENVVLGIAIQPRDGSIFLIGSFQAIGTSTQTWVLAHLNPDGTPVAGFGQDGVVSLQFPGVAAPEASAIALQSDGKILVGGRLFFSSQNTSRPFVARFNTDGTLDPTFQNYTAPFPGASSFLSSLGEDQSGRIVVVGRSDSNNRFSVSVLQPGGSPDDSFGQSGVVQEGGFGPGSIVAAETFTSGGDIVAVGDAGLGDPNRPTRQDFAVAQYTPSGKLDQGFGAGGIDTIDFANQVDSANCVALDLAGDLIVAGATAVPATATSNPQPEFALARLTSYGALDTSFGPNGDGLVTTTFADTATGGTGQTGPTPSFAVATTVLVQPDGNIVLAGVSDGRIALARYLYGAPDVFSVTLPNAVTHTDVTVENAVKGKLEPVAALDPTAPGLATLPIGAFSFVAHTRGIQGPIPISLSLPADVPPGTVDSVYAFGPTTDDGQPHWYRLPVAANTMTPGVQIFPDHIVVNLVDGGLGDGDLAANGVITTEIAPAVDLGATGSISGTVFHDANANGKRDTSGSNATEEGLAGWTVYLDTNRDGQLDPGEPLATTTSGTPGVTGPDGQYEFTGLARQSDSVAEIPPAGQADDWLNTAPGRFLPTTIVAGRPFNPSLSQLSTRSVALLDRHHDGFPDLVVVTNDSTLTYNAGVYANNHNGTFTLQQPLFAGDDPETVAVADLTGNGLLDLVVCNTLSDDVTVFLGQPDGSFKPESTTFPVGHGPVDVAVGDFIGDGKPDIITADHDASTLSVLLGNGDGTFGSAQPMTLGFRPVSLTLGHFSRLSNNVVDVLVKGLSQNAVLLGDGDGTFRLLQTITGQSVAVGHFHGAGDSSLDLAVEDDQASTLTIWSNGGDGPFQEVSSMPLSSGQNDVVAGDFTGTGKNDLVVVNTTSGVATLLRGNDDRTFTSLGAFPVPGHADFVTAGDITGLGQASVLLVDQTTGMVSALIGNPGLEQTARVGDQGDVKNLDFGNVPLHAGAIQGTVFEDLNGSGTLAAGDPGLSGWLVYLDLRHDGNFTGNPITFTDSQGNYAFPNVLPGSYLVRVAFGPPGQGQFTQTYPVQGYNLEPVAAGQVVTTVDFGLKPAPGQISGVVWNDVDGNGVRDNGEAGVEGVTVFLDLSGDGKDDPADPRATTGPDGTYRFDNLPAGHGYAVALDLAMTPNGGALVQTFPNKAAGLDHNVTVTSGASTEADFGIAAGATISGQVTGDGAAGAQVYLDTNNDGQYESGEPLAMADSQGNYVFTDVAPGSYVVGLVRPDQGRTAFHSSGDPGRFQPHSFGSSIAVTGHTLIVGDPAASSVIPVSMMGIPVPAPQSVGDVQVFNATTGAQLSIYQDPALARIDPNYPPEAGTFKDFGLAVAGLGDPLGGAGLLSITEPATVNPNLFGGGSQLASAKTFSASIGDASVVLDGVIPSNNYSDVGGTSVARHSLLRLVGDPVRGHVTVTDGNTSLFQVLAPDFQVAGIPSAFGEAVAWLGDGMLVGAPGFQDDSGAHSGRAFLFSEPPPGPGVPSTVYIGPVGLTAVVNNQPVDVVPGSYVTFKSPTSDDASFGAAVVARGLDVLIGAPTAGGAGRAYVFNDFGGLLLSLASPSASKNASFGFSVAALGNNILVGAPNDSSRGSEAGAVYLFDSTTGQLLQTFYSPHPQPNGHFGFAIAAYGTDRFFVGAPGDDPNSGGAVYLVGTGIAVTVEASQVRSGINLTQTLTPDYMLTAPSQIFVSAGGRSTAVLSTTALEGYDGAISFAVSDSQPGITATGGGQLDVGDAATISVMADATATGTSLLLVTVMGASGSPQRQVAIAVTVLSPQPTQPDFAILATPSSAVLFTVEGASVTVSAVGVGGFQGPLDLSVQGLLPGEVYSVSNPLEIGGSSTITFSLDLSAVPSSVLRSALQYQVATTVYLTASSGSVTHQASVELDLSVRPSEILTLVGVAFFSVYSSGGTLMNDQVTLSDPDPSGGFPPGTTMADFPYGFFSFEVHGVSPGQHVTLVLLPLVPLGNSPKQYWKFGSPGRDARGIPLPKQWYPFSYDPVTDTGAEIIGDEIILHLVDGQRGDDDLTADGVIQDPGGLAIVTPRDVSLSMKAVPDPVSPGRKPTFALTFTTTATNRSAIAAPGLVVTDSLPAGVAFVSATCDLGTCVFDGSAVVWSLGTLGPGASAAIRLILRPIRFGPVTNTATLSGASVDPSRGNPVATATASSLPAGRLDRFVTTLYVEILDRFPGPHDQAHWVGRIKSGVDPRGVARALYGSREHRLLVRQHLAPLIPPGWSYLVAVRAARWEIPKGVERRKLLGT
jgi:uncharacterized delta-60 repeat protein/uncharacterized repeat protein (TIGR01451 family)